MISDKYIVFDEDYNKTFERCAQRKSITQAENFQEH